MGAAFGGTGVSPIARPTTDCVSSPTQPDFAPFRRYADMTVWYLLKRLVAARTPEKRRLLGGSQAAVENVQLGSGQGR